MFTIRTFTVVGLILALSALAYGGGDPYAAPTDEQVRKDVFGKGKGVIEVKLSERPGKKIWSSVHKQYFWERLVVVKRAANLSGLPKATVLVGGLASIAFRIASSSSGTANVISCIGLTSHKDVGMTRTRRGSHVGLKRGVWQTPPWQRGRDSDRSPATSTTRGGSSERWSCRSSSRIWICTLTSSADTASSRMSTLGRTARALAMAARCFSPPDSRRGSDCSCRCWRSTCSSSSPSR